MRRRYELRTRQWQRLAPLLPHRTHHGGKGHPWLPHHRALHGILWVLHTGAPWRDVPERYGPWQTVYDRFNRWRRDGTWATILTELLDHLDRHGGLSRDLWCVDASVIRASRAAAGAKKTGGRTTAAGRSEGSATRRADGSCVGTLARRLRHEGPRAL
ncbi:MAG TPA: IS5 family transposase [Pirellulales bacterium]|nr:IS5 family transposase [Pirellulales bacterium]